MPEETPTTSRLKSYARDLFALAALMGLCAVVRSVQPYSPVDLAERAYRIADAMLVAREQKGSDDAWDA